MLKLGCFKPVHRESGTFILFFWILCYSNFSNNVMLAGTVDIPSYAKVPSFWNTSTRNEILISQGHGTYPSFTLGLITSSDNAYDKELSENQLAIYFFRTPNDVDPTFIWSSNISGVSYGAYLNLTFDGNLVVSDEYRTELWSSDTSGLAVESMHLKDDGNLVLLNGKGVPVWESYNNPSSIINTVLNVKQGFLVGQRLTSNTSVFNLTGNYYVEWETDGLHAYVNFVDPPQQYNFWDYQTYNSTISRYIKYDNQQGYNFSFMFLDVDGHLKWVDWNHSNSYITDFWNENEYTYGDCSYPMTCGEYGVCLDNECSCPIGKEGNLEYFKPLNQYNISLGCTLLTPLSCSKGNTSFLELEQVAYFYTNPTLVGMDPEVCQKACLDQCSCKAVFFHYYENPSYGNCTLTSEVLTLMDVSNRSLGHEVITFLKVQNNTSREVFSNKKIIFIVLISFIFLVFVAGGLCFVVIRAKNIAKKNEFSLVILVDTISRFSVGSLKLATQNFKIKLGRGGFGSVYEGTLVDGTKVAVKCLESCHQGTKEFLAEVNTIGSIHHFNLVRLIGFCDEGLNRLLVYEYMYNGSLDKWIFNDDLCETLTWTIRRKIIEGVAAGLEYLHEHCKKNVIHFDIKPQNILLDEDFNVKISDFGLAKMVDRDESQVMTVVKGTPGYMAPELINNSAISVKVDVYSLGVVILEIVCGRRNFGSLEEDILINLVKAKADEDQLFDLIDLRVQDMQQQKEEVVNMMKIGIWCLQPHFIRPTISKVVKVLQDLSNMEALNNLSDLTMVIETSAGEATYNSLFRPVDSILSGPR